MAPVVPGIVVPGIIMALVKGTVGEMVEAAKRTRKPNVSFWFGKHDGEKIQDVLAEDRPYLIWLLRNIKPGSQRMAILQNKIRVVLGFPEQDLGNFAPGNGKARRQWRARLLDRECQKAMEREA